MKKIKEFLKVNNYVVVWTACYVAAMFLILLLMFNFNMFSIYDWSILMRAQLRGFAGFVFGLLILSAIPMYVATTVIIIRTKKPIFEIFPKKEEKKEPEEKKKPEASAEEIVPLPAGIPSELVGAFLRARRNIANRPESAFDMKDVYTETEPATVTEPVPETMSGLPLPDDFDFATSGGDDLTQGGAPIFKEISFGTEPDKKEEPAATDSGMGEKTKEIDGNVSLVNGMAIITHDDSDFWIADDEHWFASGKQKESPIAQAIAIAEKNELSPAVYLAEKNIMDLDNQIEKWQSMGVKIITDPSELKSDAKPELLKKTV